MLAELEAIRRELRPARALPVPTPARSPAPPPSEALPLRAPAPLPPPPPVVASPSPYLIERLRVAELLSATLTKELVDLERRSNGFQTAMQSLHLELERARTELDEEGRVGRRRPPGGAARMDATEPLRSRPGGRPDPPASRLASTPVAPFPAFTVGRYNETVQGTRRRWGRVALTVGMGAFGISFALEYLLLLAREPVPAWWLAGLPLIWLIPVPFFLSAFRGTHRVLRRVPLGLPGVS